MIDPVNFGIKGLSEQEVLAARKTHGKNTLDYKQQHKFIDALKDILQEPMVLLLSIASGIYFLTGNIGDGIFLASAIVLVASISFYQESKSRNALEKLKNITQPKAKVIRDGELKEIQTHDLVIGDSVMVEEGTIIPADGVIIHSNDFSVNESLLTGESMAVFKDAQSEKNKCYTGTMVASGLAIATITAIGNATALGKIGKSLESIQEEKTPLELQIASFVKKMSIVGGITFLFVWGINYYNTLNLLESLLKALTLAMSILPEEIPVAFTTFMALGSWRLMKLGIVVKQIKTVESLGSATVICIDKTGTITQNKMSLVKLYLFKSDQIVPIPEKTNLLEEELITAAMWSSEPIPFDPMEIALHETYSKIIPVDERQAYKMVHEYPLGGKPPMMTHLFENQQGERIIAAKGAPEAFFPISNLKDTEKGKIQKAITILGDQGYRLLGVGTAKFIGTDYPETQQEFLFDFLGLVAFYDPPKKNIGAVLKEFDRAGITVKLITGDTATTASAIAKEVNFIGYEKGMTGTELMQLDDKQLQEKVKDIQVFSRMFPDAKLRIINALKANNEVVAMIGDGVNDGPALKAAHFGIAMGTKGTEIAKEAASLILVDDDLSKMIDSIAMGRKIYSNLKKAIQYIISIHIPIILTVFIPLALGWAFPNIFSPTHVILLELIMGPTCSIIYENEPLEKNTMLQKPRLLTTTFFNLKELLTSIIQGLAITVGTLSIYQYGIAQNFTEDTTRTMVFLVLIAANIFLTLINRSFYYSLYTTLKYKNNLVPLIIAITVVITASLLFIPPFTHFFQFSSLSFEQLFLSMLTGFISVIWFEIVKWNTRKKTNNTTI
ncbi:ATPase, P-type (transporting), HAD superfamily, subfamily IC [Cellulophaga algicola DSM 14237]|uniref:ATPase, P-type (Transporting), HAD superfamily, subfamily IC n=1 Tax=Cellulophaga algicola (strain DSM 14237 / IC166 / ACAM 630) TaxID=688270 RepID=E6XF74_CELAD|nr:cation-translocating P-type ATPase [Cellulophaga algicola]ADV50310.1 ATPase, P-type (transporting), HAD superfamily, subfamily IC [Cellulophaga algicola DSM 14237]